MSKLDPAIGNDGPVADQVESNVQNTILEIFGPNSHEYDEHQYFQISKGPFYIGMSAGERQDSFKRGIEHTLVMLRGLIDRLEEKKLDLPTGEVGSEPKASQVRRVFIGHGRSMQWLKLKDFVVERLRLQYEEFNRESPAGYSTKERLQQMLAGSSFAFLIMTAEDEHADGSRHARENVIHEIGLFQGRHSFERAIVLLEDGCEGFSNIAGLTVIKFPKDHILASSKEIRRVLEREGLLPERSAVNKVPERTGLTPSASLREGRGRSAATAIGRRAVPKRPY